MSRSSEYQNMLDSSASAYGANPQVLGGISRLESGDNPNARNGWDSNAQAGHASVGAFQFVPSTYAAFSKQAMAANPGAWRGINNTLMDPHAQALTTAWAITHGHSGDWSTYKRALAGAGGKVTGIKSPAIATPATPGTPAATDSTLQSVLQSGGISPLIAQMLATSDAVPGTPGVAATPSIGGSTGTLKLPVQKGVANFGGKQVAGWIAPALQWARQHGWTGGVTSGFRSLADQTRIYNSGVRPAARPGTSNHEGADFPRGAVDVSQAQQLAQILKGSPYASQLQWAGAKDPVHFSHPHGGSY